MKLLFICHLTQHALNDTVRAMRYLGQELVRRGHEVDYFFRRAQPHEPHRPISPLEWPVRVAPLIRRKCEQKQYNVILSTGTSGWCLSSFRDWLLPQPTRLVSWHLKDELSALPPNPQEALEAAAPLPASKHQLIEQLSEWTVSQSLKTQDGCFLTGLEDLHQIRAEFPQYASKALYQPRGVAAHFYSPQRLMEKTKLPSKLLLIGNTEHGHPIGDTLAKAFQRIWETHPQATLTVAGAKLPQADALFADFPEPMKPALSAIHIQEEGHLPDLYLQHDVLIQPHPTPGLPLAVLEAMASAMPAVIAQNPNFQEVVSHYESGMLVPPHDANALAESVSHLLENPQLCRDMGEAAFETVSRCYTWHQVCDIFEANLTRIVEQSPQSNARPD
ncbi:glycosyltransferase family 4 protein [Vampirovibrio sp.]|uniref:glycosyltransferase family 4 protein n=1 Tax=Vampirovibrio sp. TaxID=2717857 RepID=UPI0035949399